MKKKILKNDQTSDDIATLCLDFDDINFKKQKIASFTFFGYFKRHICSFILKMTLHICIFCIHKM